MGKGIFTIIIAAVCLSTAAFAEEKYFPTLPTFDIYPTPSGIVYPSLLDAAGVNPAGLPQSKKVTALGIEYSPSPGSGSPHEYSAAFATGDTRFGFGAGYVGSLSTYATHGMYMGAGFRTESTSIGLDIRNPDFSTGFSPQVDLGIIAKTASDISIGLVLYKLEQAPQLDVGLGFGKDKNYNFELNLLLPVFSNVFQPGANYILTAATTVYAGWFGISFKSSYLTETSSVTQTVSLDVWVSKKLALTLQYSSPNRTYYGLVWSFN